MQTKLFYFTGTGNSLYAAKRIQELLHGEVELISISKALKEKNLSFEAERIGFIFPLYYGGLPVMVENFVKLAEFHGVQYSFVLASTGMTQGMTAWQMEDLLKEKGIGLNHNAWLCFTSNYVRKFKMSNDTMREKKLLSTEKKLEEFCDEINKGKTIKIPRKPFLSLIFKGFYRKWRSEVNTISDNFKASETCKGCGICEKVCPGDNIVIKEGKPQWQSRCEDCMACIQNCPSESIQIPGETEERGRYRHIHISVKEIIAANN